MYQQTEPASLHSLDDDVILVILSYCDIKSLGRLACSCTRLYNLASKDCIWLRHQKLIHTKIQSRKVDRINVKEQCQLARNWTNAVFTDLRLITYSVKQMPWLQLDENNKLWVTNKNTLESFQQKSNGMLQKVFSIESSDDKSDVTRFKIKKGILVSGSRNGNICGYNHQRGNRLFKISGQHTSDIHDVDFSENVIVSGSRDETIKVWNMRKPEGQMLSYSIQAQDRVWSLAMNPNASSFVTGSAGRFSVPPLRLWDVERGQLLNTLGSEYKNGAGVLALYFESPHILFSGGYDTYTRMWDLRTPLSSCVQIWEEPFDSTIYTLKSDGDNSFLTGTSQHGLIHLWDKRKQKPVQRYYVGRAHNNSSTPVYSLTFSARYLYAGLDRGIHLLNFCAPTSG